MKQVIFREDQVPALDTLASKLGVNRSVIVRWACDDLLQKNLSSISLERNLSTSENGAQLESQSRDEVAGRTEMEIAA